MLFISPQIRVAEDELQFSYVRSSGPGGQNVNKLNTKAVLRWRVTVSRSLRDDIRARFLSRYSSRITKEGDVVVTSQRFRDQRQNERDVREKLVAMIASVAMAPKRRKRTKPTKASVERRRTHKRAHSIKKQGRRRVAEE